MTEIKKAIAIIAMECHKTKTNGLGSINGKPYKYALLSDIQDSLKEILKESKLFYEFKIDEGDSKGVSLLFRVCSFEEEEWEDWEKVFIPFIQTQGENQFQNTGEGITYFKKYFLTTKFNLQVVDNDAAGKQIKPVRLETNTNAFNEVVDALRNKTMSAKDVEIKYIIPEKTRKALNTELAT